MKISDRETIKKKSADVFTKIYDRFKYLENIPLSSFDTDKTVLVIVDVINGFIREGAMADSRIEYIIQGTAKLLEKCIEAGIPAVAFADSHCENAEEFSSYPVHCISGSPECELVNELKEKTGYILAEKNSTNGFFSPVMQKFLSDNPERTDFIVCGDCTDICVMNFCLSLKAYFDQNNIRCSVAVLSDLTETYNSDQHDADIMNLAASEFMKNAGIKIAGGVEYD